MKKLLFIVLLWTGIAFAVNDTPKSNITSEKQVEKIEISPGFFIEADFTPIYSVFWKTFKKLDTGEKGYLVRADFRPHFLMWIASWKYFSIIDEDKDGKISKEEMDRFIKKEAASQRKKFIEAWKKFDTNQDGLMSREEARESDFLDSRFDKIDANKDGYLSPQEVIIAYSKELDGFA